MYIFLVLGVHPPNHSHTHGDCSVTRSVEQPRLGHSGGASSEWARTPRSAACAAACRGVETSGVHGEEPRRDQATLSASNMLRVICVHPNGQPY